MESTPFLQPISRGCGNVAIGILLLILLGLQFRIAVQVNQESLINFDL